MEKITIFWFRRDLRLEDNTGLYHALKSDHKVLPLFIFDENILEKLTDKTDRRLQFIHENLLILQEKIRTNGGELLVKHGRPKEIWAEIIKSHPVVEVYTNHDYEPYATERDSEIRELLATQNIQFKTFKDQVVFEKNEIIKSDGTPYTVFTPYSKKWREMLSKKGLNFAPSEKHLQNFLPQKPTALPTLKEIGFQKTETAFPARSININTIKNYAEKRDFPAANGTTHLSAHLRFGTISIRKLVEIAQKYSETWLNELIWREFYMMILWHFPHVVGHAFKKQYENLPWLNDKAQFQAWCEGRTGYPLVDAGMRELNTTGFMHNRVRMVTASFLVKHLLIDWRWGEAYFAEKLLDFELSSNNGGWQWAASTGCDAAPYFRIFNPNLQLKRFDSEQEYVKVWLPEVDKPQYPQPIIDHSFARQRAIKWYKENITN